jgi:hypothetical protein
VSADGDRHRLADRVDRSARAARAVRGEVAAWFQVRADDARLGRFTGQLRLLADVLEEMFDALERSHQELEPAMDAGTGYERCRDLDRNLLVVQRLFAWYAAKYDQRRDDRNATTLAAADEVVRSCWTEPFVRIRQPAPPGPLAYLDSRFDAFATPRVSVPPDLRAPTDALVAEFVAELPIPTVALPDSSRREPWWLVLAAHETGHHVQRELAGGALEADARTALRMAAGGQLADAWSRWALEAFADAWSVLMVGSAAAWAIDELQFGTPRTLLAEPDDGGRYPPPAVRLALLAEVARAVGLEVPVGQPDAATVLAQVRAFPPSVVGPRSRTAAEEHLAVVPRVAAALVGLPVAERTLRDISGLDTRWFAPGGRVPMWALQLGGLAGTELTPVQPRHSARAVIAAGIAAYRAAAARPHDEAPVYLPRLRDALFHVLARCGGPGTLASHVTADGRAVGRRLAERLARADRAPMTSSAVP